MTNPDILIRPMSKQDYPRVAEIYCQGIQQGDATYQTEAPDFETFDQYRLTDCRLVAVHNQKVIGWVALTPFSSLSVFSGVAELSLYLDQAMTGIGLGTRLMNALIDCSEKAGLWSLQSGIFRENKASIALHEKCGFRTIGYRETPGQMADGRWRDVVLMERRSQKIGI